MCERRYAAVCCVLCVHVRGGMEESYELSELALLDHRLEPGCILRVPLPRSEVIRAMLLEDSPCCCMGYDVLDLVPVRIRHREDHPALHDQAGECAAKEMACRQIRQG